MAGPDPAIAALGARLLRTRALVRAPVRLYLLGLGPLLGRRILMLGHTGRSSGRRRLVVLEAMGRTPGGNPVVVSGFGEGAQWCRNVHADPRVLVWWGTRQPRGAVARRLDETAARLLVRAYARERPRTWRLLVGTMERVAGRSLAPETFDLPLFELDLD